jgi:hypothetical protein
MFPESRKTRAEETANALSRIVVPPSLPMIITQHTVRKKEKK